MSTDRERLAIWKSENDFKTRFQSLQGVEMPEFFIIGKDIVKKFNERTGLKINNFSDIPIDLILEQDTTIVNEYYNDLAGKLLKLDFNEIIRKACQTMTPSQIMRITTCAVILQKQGILNANSSLTQEILNEMQNYQPTATELESLGCSKAMIQNILELCKRE